VWLSDEGIPKMWLTHWNWISTFVVEKHPMKWKQGWLFPRKCNLRYIWAFRKWHAYNYEWYRLYRSYENCRRPGVAILDMQMSKIPIISGYADVFTLIVERGKKWKRNTDLMISTFVVEKHPMKWKQGWLFPRKCNLRYIWALNRFHQIQPKLDLCCVFISSRVPQLT
jgi:hypothetical protein